LSQKTLLKTYRKPQSTDAEVETQIRSMTNTNLLDAHPTIRPSNSYG
jgi:hypothetical protein